MSEFFRHFTEWHVCNFAMCGVATLMENRVEENRLGKKYLMEQN